MHRATRPPPLPLDRQAAWSRIVLNLLVWPGLGTWARDRVRGGVQMLLSAAGAGAAASGLLLWIAALLRTLEVPPWDGAAGRLLVGGMGLFGVAWLWALGSGLRLLRGAARRPPAAGSAAGAPDPGGDP